MVLEAKGQFKNRKIENVRRKSFESLKISQLRVSLVVVLKMDLKTLQDRPNLNRIKTRQ